MARRRASTEGSASTDLTFAWQQCMSMLNNKQVYIKDVKSSNGTFINGERLSPEAVESDIFELHNNDMVEFGIDITSEDQKTIVHHKVAARCFLVMNAEDAVATTR